MKIAVFLRNFLRDLSWLQISRFCLYLFVAFLPFSIDVLVYGTSSGSNIFNPYVSHFLHINDLFLLGALVCLGLNFLFGKKGDSSFRFVVGDLKIFVLLLAFLLAYFVSVVGSVDKVNSLIYAFRMVEFFILYLFLVGGLVDLRRLFWVFVGAVTISAGIGVIQYFLQHSLGLHFFGESVLSDEMLNVAKIDLGDGKIMRAYATFPHPNIFAGYLVFSLYMIFYLFKGLESEIKKGFLYFCVILCSLALILTFSRSGILAFLAGGVVYFAVSNAKIVWKHIIFAIVLLVFFIVVLDLGPAIIERVVIGDDFGLGERSMLLSTSKSMFLSEPFGVGAGNFTQMMQNFSGVEVMPWQFQPVHNLFLLVLNELGIFGLGAFILMFGALFWSLLKSVVRENSIHYIVISLWGVILLIGLFDHYLISLYLGQALLWLFLGVAKAKVRDFSK